MLLLSQEPSPVQLLGLVLVVIAGAAAQRGGHRAPMHDVFAGGVEPALHPLALEPK